MGTRNRSVRYIEEKRTRNRRDNRQRRRKQMWKLRVFCNVTAIFLACCGIYALGAIETSAGDAREICPTGYQESGENHLKKENSVALHGKGHLIENVPYINQREHYPNGCESVSAVMALQYLGFAIDVDTFIDNYLPMGPLPYEVNGVHYGADPWTAFPGDPREETGLGCYAPVIEQAVNRYLSGNRCQKKENIKAVYLKNQSMELLCKTYIDKDIPVVLWATLNMRPTEVGSSWITTDSGKTFTWIRYLHCLLLVGYDDENYYFHDPMETANIAYPRTEVEIAYRAMNEQAVVIE